MEEFIKNNPAFQGMDAEKLQFIMEFAGKEKPGNMKDAMPFLMANMKQAQKRNLHFSDTEIQLIVKLLCQNLSEEDLNKVKKVMTLMGKPMI